MAIALKINGVDKTSYLTESSLNIDGQLNSLKNASFTLVEEAVASTGLVASGNEIIIENDGTRVFAGPVKLVSEEQPFSVNAFYYQVEAYCFGSYLNNYIIAEVYENQSAGDIIKNIVDTYLIDDGFTYAAVETGPTITKAVFNYISANQAFNEISEKTGYGFYVDCFKDVHFFVKETNVAPFSLTDAQKNCTTLKITDTHEDYRNVQFLRAGKDITENQTELFSGDGKNITYTLSYPVAESPAITVNTVSKTVGILGIDSGKNFYWNKDDKNITQEPSDTILISSDELSVTYKGFFPLIIKAENTEEIAAREAAENGHGRYESIIDDGNIDNLDLAIEKANGLLRRFGKISRIIDFTTFNDGLSEGQLITIQLTAHGIDDNFLIESVSANDEPGVGLIYSVRALSGESFGGWVDFFAKLARTGRQYVIRENEVLTLMRYFSDNVLLTDSLTTSTTTPDCEIGTAEIGYSEVC